MVIARTYKAKDGTEYPLTEAEYDISFRAYKSHKRKAVVGDPTSCILALGIMKNPEVKEVYIGTGRDAYVIFHGRGRIPAKAVHFTIPAEAGRIRDKFDSKGAPATQQVTLKAPTDGRTLAHRSALNAKRRAEVKAGAEVLRRGPQVKRITRLGVPHRPRAHIAKGVVEISTPVPAD